MKAEFEAIAAELYRDSHEKEPVIVTTKYHEVFAAIVQEWWGV